jgi:uncharacterized membrane protein/thiol-disulfide isomerase/thioredoxin
MSQNTHNVEEAVIDYLRLIGLDASPSYVKRIIVGHPEYPSLLSVVDALEILGLAHGVQRISDNRYEEVEFPYLVHTEESGGGLHLIRNEAHLKTQKSAVDTWSGIILKVDASQPIDDEINSISLTKERISRFSMSLLLAGFGVAALAALGASFSYLNAGILTSSLAGLLVSYLLVAQDLGVKYKAVENFCSSSTGSGCDKILGSDKLVLFGGIKLSDVTAAYFIGQFALILAAFTFSGSERFISLTLAVMALAALPAILFSLYYQYFIAKTWCKLCLIVNAVLVFQVALLVTKLPVLTDIKFSTFASSLLLAAGILLFMGALVLLIMDKLKQSNELQVARVIGNRIKYNPVVFTQLLSMSQRAHEQRFEHELFIGNAHAPVVLTMVSNLFCSPCKKEFESVIQLLNNYPEKVKVRFVFVSSAAKEGEPQSAVQYLFNYWQNEIEGQPEEGDKTALLLWDWFSLMNYQEFRSLRPLASTSNVKESELLSMAHSAWISNNEVVRTPTLYVNGHRLPENYFLHDLRYLIPSLSEHFASSASANLPAPALVAAGSY